jgi:flagellar protein FlaI
MAEKRKDGARSWRNLFGREKTGEKTVAGEENPALPGPGKNAQGTSPAEDLERLVKRLGISLEQPEPQAPASPGFAIPFPRVGPGEKPAGGRLEEAPGEAVEEPAGKPVEEPANVPPKEPIETLLQRLVNKPAGWPAEQPAEEPGGIPVTEPVNEPAETSAESLPKGPAKESAEEPAEEPGEVPPEEPLETLLQRLVNKPAGWPAEQPAEEPGGIPVTEPVNEPAETSAESPPKGPVEESAEEPAEEPAEVPPEEPIETLLESLAKKPAEVSPEKTEEIKETPEQEKGEEGTEEAPAEILTPPPGPVIPPGAFTPPVFEEESGGEKAGETTSLPASGPQFTPAKKTIWSEGTAGEEAGGVISIDQIDDLSGLILPRGASFEIDELKIRGGGSIFSPKGTEGIPFQSEELRKSDISQSGMRTITQEAAGVEAEGEKKGMLSKLNILSVIRHEVVEYNPRIHGPMVNLKWRPKPGMEEIELYPVNEPYAYVRVIYDHATHEYTYEVMEPELSPAEIDLFHEIKERIFERLDINTTDVIEDFAKKTLRNATDDIIADFGIKLTPLEREKILYEMYKEFLGNGKIDPIMHDRYIEDISCDGVNTHLFVYHTRYESMRTNLEYKSAEELDSFVTKLAQKSGKYISIAEPMLDATMSDGSRIQMTLGHEVTAHGSTFTIRKFREEPISPTDLIEWSTFSPLSIAFLWLAVESGKSAIFAGGTASGKTTSLNAISLFIPPLAKIVTLEDTRELKLPHPNWIPSITRASFDTAGKGEIDMYELLRAALRQRPEYLIVGEVRGREALTLFQAMSTGHVTYSTMHADSVASIVHRLENPPLNVPRNMLSALDIVCVQVQARVGGQRIRRNKQLIEILDLDPRTNELITNEVFKWHPSTDEITYSGKSFILEEIMEEKGWDEARMREELKMRQEVLEWMRVKKIRNYQDVANILTQYHREPASVMERVRADLYE